MANNDGKELTGHITTDKDRFPVDSAIYMGPKTLITVEYCGNHIYRNGKLERVLNDYGYYADGAYHFNITDYQGNIRSVIREDGTLEETSSYYPYGGLMGSGSMGIQPYKYGGKELDRIGGINHYDFHARQLQLPIPHYYQQDPYADRYPHLSPYLYCAANPIRYIDPSGERVELYATSLPGSELPFATHTFIVVRDETNKVKGYYAYGSEYEGVKGAFTGRLMQVNYTQDMMVYNNKDTKHLKKIIEITPPKGMNSLDFDKKVMSVAESFGNSSDITYFLAPSGSNLTKGNCNTSTSTILLKSGISKEQIDKIKAEIPGLSWGFNSNPRPWTKQEQMEAKKIQNQIEFLYNLIIKP